MITVFNKYIKNTWPSLIRVITKNESIRIDINLSNFLGFLHFLKDHTAIQCKQLIEIAVVDVPKNSDYRFSVNYILYSPRYSTRIILNTQVDELTPLPSVINLFQSANWLEREVWDLFGIFFTGHSDLRRILTDYGFQGHPLRKDFPLSGFTSLIFSDTKGRIMYSKTKLSQEFRVFNLHQHIARGFKTNTKANRYGISIGTMQNVMSNHNAYTSKFKLFLVSYLMNQAFLRSKKTALLKQWSVTNYVIYKLKNDDKRAVIEPLRPTRSRRKNFWIHLAEANKTPQSKMEKPCKSPEVRRAIKLYKARKLAKRLRKRKLLRGKRRRMLARQRKKLAAKNKARAKAKFKRPTKPKKHGKTHSNNQ